MNVASPDSARSGCDSAIRDHGPRPRSPRSRPKSHADNTCASMESMAPGSWKTCPKASVAEVLKVHASCSSILAFRVPPTPSCRPDSFGRRRRKRRSPCQEAESPEKAPSEPVRRATRSRPNLSAPNSRRTPRSSAGPAIVPGEKPRCSLPASLILRSRKSRESARPDCP